MLSCSDTNAQKIIFCNVLMRKVNFDINTEQQAKYQENLSMILLINCNSLIDIIDKRIIDKILDNIVNIWLAILGFYDSLEVENEDEQIFIDRIRVALDNIHHNKRIILEAFGERGWNMAEL